MPSVLQSSDLEHMGKCQLPGLTTHEFYVNSGGDLYVRGLADCIVEGAQFQIHGFFKTGREASELIASAEGAVYPYKLSEDSFVLMRGKPGKSLPACVQQFSVKAGALKDVMNALLVAGLPKPAIHLHSCENTVNGNNVEWKILALEPACLKPSVEEAPEDPNQKFPPPVVPHAKLSSFVALNSLSQFDVLFCLEYDAQANKLKGMMPQAVMKHKARISKDSIAKL